MNDQMINALLGVWAMLRAQHQLFWTYHWRAKGQGYYSDHLLFQRLYEARIPEIDRMGEVIMAVGGPEAVDPVRSWIGVKDVIDRTHELGDASDVVKSIALVKEALARIEAANRTLGKNNYSIAINNVLAGIADKQLEALYLLQQRAGG